MSVAFKKCSIESVSEGTIGGDTYCVKLPGKPEPRKICFRRLRADHSLRCTNPAGYGTDHPGTGACKRHGGQNNPAIVNGKQAYVTKHRLHDKIQTYLEQDRDKLLDMTEQMAATKAMFDEFLTVFPDPTDEGYGIWLARFNGIINTMSVLAERISKMDTRNALTAQQVLYLKAVMIDMFMKYIPDPSERMRAIKELAGRMGGDVAVEMRMSEIPGLGNGDGQ